MFLQGEFDYNARRHSVRTRNKRTHAFLRKEADFACEWDSASKIPTRLSENGMGMFRVARGPSRKLFSLNLTLRFSSFLLMTNIRHSAATSSDIFA